MTATPEAGHALPPPKRRKLSSKAHEKVSRHTENPFHPFRLIPSPNESRALETSLSLLRNVLMVVGVWVTSALASAKVDPLLKFIQKRLTPLDIAAGVDLTHLKRVRKTGSKNDEGADVLDVILCATSTLRDNEIQEVVRDAGEQGIELVVREENVSRWPAYTPRQLDEFKKLWPTGLRIDSSRHVKSPVKEAAKMKDFMTRTIALLPDIIKLDLPITSLLVNPKTSQILAIAHDTRRSSTHPLHHSIMKLLASLPTHPQTAKPTTEDEEQYYAQEYDVYTTHEPCTMCAMALVHSRIRRLCFWRGMKTGARELGWMTGGEGEEGLNHRYLVFEGVEGGLGDDVEGMVEDLGDDVCA